MKSTDTDKLQSLMLRLTQDRNELIKTVKSMQYDLHKYPDSPCMKRKLDFCSGLLSGYKAVIEYIITYDFDRD